MTEIVRNDKLVWDADIYSKFRKNVPEEIVSKTLLFLKDKFKGSLDTAIDVGCGTGQSTIVLAPHFKHVYGIDESEALIYEAVRSRSLDNIKYSVGCSENLPFEDNVAQLITASSCMHWFELNRFFAETRRILCSNGVLAVFRYSNIKPLFESQRRMEEVEKMYYELRTETHFFEYPQLSMTDQNYRTVHFPFEEVTREYDIRCLLKGNLDDVVGYVDSESPLKRLRQDNYDKAEDIFNEFKKRLYDIATEENISPHKEITLCRDFTLILCRKTDIQ